MYKKKQKSERYLFLKLFVGMIPVCYFLLLFLSGTFMSFDELTKRTGSVFSYGKGVASFFLLPQYPTGENIKELLLETPGFYVTYWNSWIQTAGVLLIQCLVSVPAAWAFGRFEFRGKDILYFFYLLLMLLPFQVMMLSEYLVLDKLQLMNTIWAVILPAGFSTGSVIIMTSFFAQIPEELIEAAKVDGASELTIFLQIGIPIGKGGILSALLLSFLEQFNAVERPMNFLKEKTLWPLSIYLPHIMEEKMSVAFAASLIGMIPCLLIFLLGQEYLEQGITAGAIK